MLVFTPLAGSANAFVTRPLAYILVIDDVRILLDCGSFPPGTPLEVVQPYHDALQKEAPNVDLILFSHGDLAHFGLYPFAHARWKLTAPAYASIPVQAMGRMAVVEELEDISAEEFVAPRKVVVDGEDDAMAVDEAQPEPDGKAVATRQEVNGAFDAISTLRYSEPIHLSGKCQGITITPYSAGHTLGGTLWKIRSPSSGTIVYAVDMNHTKERHLDGTIILRPGGGGVFEGLARPDLLITDADRALVMTPRRKDRDTAFLDMISTTIRTSHSVLVPCDASTRILELLVLLDQYWTFQKLTTPICFVSKTGQEMLTYVRSMIEWMGGNVSKEEGTELDISKIGRRRRREDEEEEAAIGPVALRFKHVRFFPTASSFLAEDQNIPRVILAVPYNFSHGPSRKLFTTFAQEPGNLIILTAMSESRTLGDELFNLWNAKQSEEDKWGKGRVGEVIRTGKMLSVRLNSKIPLVGEELEDYLAKEKDRLAKEREAAQRAALVRSQQLLEADEGDSESDESASDDEDEIAVARALDDDMDIDAGRRSVRQGPSQGQHFGSLDDDAGNRQLSFDIYVKGNVTKSTSFFKQSSSSAPRFRMFPYVEKSVGGVKRRVDEYGETLDVGMWLRRGRVLDEDAETEEVKEARRKKREEEEAKKAPPEPPSKFVTEDVEVHVACQIAYVDLEGLNDSRAVKTIIPQVNPRRMILVHASPDATTALVESCASIRAMTQQVFTPLVGESVTIGQHTKTFAISLADSLLATLKLSRFEDSEMAFLKGKIVNHTSAAMPLLEPLANAGPGVPASPDTKTQSAVKPLPQSTMIGDLKLTALRARLTALGLSAEFAGEGVLVCSGGGTGDLEQTVAVRKSGRGRISVEGSTGDVYFAIRKEIYSLHAMVAQG